jgi:hypothetical protein
LAVAALYLKTENEGGNPQAAIDQLLSPAAVDCPKDDLWGEQVSSAAAETMVFLEQTLKRLSSKDDRIHYSNKNLETMAYVLCRIARELEPSGSARQRKGLWFTSSHPAPGQRVETYRKNLESYLGFAIIHRWGGRGLE